MALYGTSNIAATTPAQTAVAATSKTMLQLAAATATLRRAFLYEWTVGPSAVPNATDCELVWTLIRQTSAGTGGVTLTMNALDQADAAAGSVALGNFTAEPTGAETGIVDTLGANQRASYRWVVAPGGPGEIVVPATNLAGYGIRTKSSTYVGTATAACKWRE
jgi:hypothetical protein